MKIKVLLIAENDKQLEMIKKYFNGSEKIEILASLSNDKNKVENVITEFNINEIIVLEKIIEERITNILHSLGIPSNIKGYQYIRSAIMMVYNNPLLMGSVTKELYPDLSIRFNTSIDRVERAIRHAIEISCLRGDIDLMEEIFGHSIDIQKSKPTNSEFIATITERLRLEMRK